MAKYTRSYYMKKGHSKAGADYLVKLNKTKERIKKKKTKYQRTKKKSKQSHGQDTPGTTGKLRNMGFSEEELRILEGR